MNYRKQTEQSLFRFNESDENLHIKGWLDFAYPIVHDYMIPKAIISDVQDHIAVIKYYPYFERELIQSIAHYLDIEPDCLLLTAGANGAIDLVSQVFWANCRVLIPAPVFWQLIWGPHRYQINVYTPDCSDITDITHTMPYFDMCDGIMLCSPHNPFSISLKKDVLEEILKKAGRKMVVVDESYADIHDETHVSLLKRYKNIVIIRGFKIFMLPGIRVGYIVASPQVIKELARYKRPFEVSSLSEVCAISVLKNIAIIRDIWRTVCTDVLYLQNKLQTLGGYVYESKTNFVYWKIHNAMNLGLELAKKKIAVIHPGVKSIYGNMQGLRITARKPKISDKLIECLKDLMTP